MKYLIFSDESGDWNKGKYYIRSWIKISPDQYELLRKEIIFSKHETSTKELKWKNFLKNLNKFKNIFLIDFEIFITISIPEHFQDRLEKNRYNIIRTLEGIKNNQSTGGEKFKEIVKEKILNSAKHTLFFNYFERQHIENSKGALVNNINDNEYKYIIDTPQCLDKDWLDIAKECNITNIVIEKKSEKIPGIELADIVAGCVHAYLLESHIEAKNIYNDYIKDKMLNKKSIKYPNPNLIFYQDFIDKEKEGLNIFR